MNDIETSMQAYIKEHNSLRYHFFGGKGGVGKTALAGATAIWLAKQDKRVMLASTNPVHSLSGLLGQNVFGQPTPVTGVPNLWAYARDIHQTPGVAGTVNFEHIKRHYYFTHDDINPHRIVPLGPELDFRQPHGRERL